MSDPRNDKRDLVLAPTEYAYMQDVTKGVVKTYAGPTVINPTAQERPVTFNPRTGKFEPCSLEAAVQQIAIAPEGYYLVLKNPTVASSAHEHPPASGISPTPDLSVGRKINVTGPCSFALWPGQMVKLVQGHHLRSNQYLLVRVYNEEEARKNWNQAVIKAVEGDSKLALPKDLTVGKLLVIKGTDVSFYIPPTGVGVVPEGKPTDNAYVREALTLERLEYCILVDQNGKKRYERGPQVVFPEPSERFFEAAGEHGPARKFRAIELNEIQGIHIKVIAPYKEGDKQYSEGDELFITGKETAIYYPREEHALIRYDGKDKHFAVAIPKGEARYVLNRKTGDIRMERGASMLLPSPIDEVIVRRVLTDKQCELWYPGNVETLTYNREMRSLQANVPTTRGAVSEGEVMRGGQRNKLIASTLGDRGVAYNSAMEASQVGQNQRMQGEEFTRSADYKGPRTVTLDTKFQGAPVIDVWNGYAVMVTSKADQRRVEVGPKTLLLDYDEGLMPLELSTGKPKTTDNLLRTAYLRINNNKISDKVSVETEDHVNIELYFSYNVDFVGDPNKWFSVENYVKTLVDHCRSILKGEVRKIPVQLFHRTATDFIRTLLLGERKADAKPGETKRPGMLFPQNGMHLVDVEVLGVTIKDERIRKLLDDSQHSTVQSSIELANLGRQLETTKVQLSVMTQTEKAKADAQLQKEELARLVANSELETLLLKAGNELRELASSLEIAKQNEAVVAFRTTADLERRKVEEDVTFAEDKRRLDLALMQVREETEAVMKRFSSAQAGFSEALLALSNNDTMIKVAQAWNIQTAIGGKSLADAAHMVFAGTPMEAIMHRILGKGPSNGAQQPIQLSSPVS